jgi:hypothetical protein
MQLAAVFGLPTTGFFAGLGLAAWAAPDSGLAAAVSGMLLPTAYAAGLLVWAGLDVIRVVLHVSRHGRTARQPSSLARRSGRWFVPLSLACASAGGIVVGAIPGGAGVMATTVVYAVAGATFGRLLSWLAAAGYIPAPDV